MVRLRGAFNPGVQIAAFLVAFVFYLLLMLLFGGAEWASELDIRLAPAVMAAGLFFGWYVGSLRLIALRKVLPQLDGRLCFSQRDVLSQVREGENALALQRNAWGWAVVAWMAAGTQQQVLVVSTISFIFGSYVSGQVVPFVRLWFELRSGQFGRAGVTTGEGPEYLKLGQEPTRLRGSFDPVVQVAALTMMLAFYLSSLWLLWGSEWVPRLDFWLSPLSLTVALLFGSYVGSLKLAALRRVVTQLHDEVYLSRRALLSQLREGRKALVLERTAWLAAFGLWLLLTVGQERLFYFSLFSFLVGSYVTGTTLPSLRFWLECRRDQQSS